MDSQRVWDEFRDKLRHDELIESDCIKHSKIDYAAFFRDVHMQALKGFLIKQENPPFEQGEEKLVFTIKSARSCAKQSLNGLFILFR